MPTPQIVTGARTADDRMVAATGPEYRTRTLAEGQVEYHSISPALRVQLTSPADTYDPATGIRTTARPKNLKFVENSAITDDPEVIHRVEGCEKVCKLHRGGIKAHPNFGLGKSFWRADHAAAIAREKRVESAARTMRENPEALQRVLKEMGVEDFVLPPRPIPQAEDSPRA